MFAIFRKKSFTAFALILALFMSSTFMFNQPAQAASLKDLNQCADYARPSVERLSQSGVVSGFANGYFYPQQTVTRGQMITLIIKSLGLDKSTVPQHTNTFKDVPQNHWANKYVEIAYQSGITSGISADQFGVNQTCTREQMITLFVNTFKVLDDELTEIPAEVTDLSQFTDKAQISDWARDQVAFAVYMGLISGTSTTTIGPKASAERQQVAVVTDRFVNKKDNIVADMQAQRILGKAAQEQLKGQGISNTGEIEIKAALQESDSSLPAELGLKAHLTNDMIWEPAALHQTISTQITGLPANETAKWDMEQYLADGILYQKIPDENNQSSWTRTSATDTADISNLMQTLKDAQIPQILLPDEIHKSAQVTLDNADVNGTNGHKITYMGQITDISALLDQLTAYLPDNENNSEILSVLDIMEQSIKSASFTEVFYVGADNLIYGNQLNINIDCKDTADSVIPVKSITIKTSMENYKYNNITIVLPPEAKDAPLAN
ncbi:MAG TPA: S-layer homology domain-containing protein [Syntrophomonadaceae bacterium]|nr:S-layer homology domain-containing protein [Syntrophomonadaceae bacterium]